MTEKHQQSELYPRPDEPLAGFFTSTGKEMLLVADELGPEFFCTGTEWCVVDGTCACVGEWTLADPVDNDVDDDDDDDGTLCMSPWLLDDLLAGVLLDVGEANWEPRRGVSFCEVNDELSLLDDGWNFLQQVKKY